MQSLRFYATGFNPATTTVINGKSGAATGLCCAAFDWGHLLDLRPVPRKAAGPLRGCHSSLAANAKTNQVIAVPHPQISFGGDRHWFEYDDREGYG